MEYPEPEISERFDVAPRVAWRLYHDSRMPELIGAFNLCYSLLAFAETGMLQRLCQKGSLQKAELADGVDDHFGPHLVRYLVIKGVLEESGDGNVRLSPWGVSLAQETAQAQLTFYVKAYGPVVSRLPGLLAGEARYGVDVHRDGGALGAACADLFRVYHDPIVLEALDTMNATKVLDIGCGAGQFLLDACARDPRLLGVGLDISADAIAIAKREAERLGLDDRLQFVVGDAFAPDSWPEPCKDADVLFGVGVLHEYFREGEDAVVGILNRFAAQQRAGQLKGFILGEPELLYDDADNDADLYLVHIFTLQGFPRRRELWLRLFERSDMKCVRLWRRAGAGPRFAFYQLTPR